MTIDASSLRIALQEEERWRRTLTVTVPAAEVTAERDRVARRLSSRLKLPGFRKGRIPSHVIEQRYGATLQKEALDKVMGQAFQAALQSQELRPISDGEVRELDYHPESDLTFSIAFDVQPEIEVARLGGFVVERPSAGVDEEDVKQVLERLLDQHGVWRPAESGSPEDGQQVSVEIERLDEEGAQPKQYEFVLGSGDAIPEVEAAIKTLEPGDSGEFTVAFPGDFPDESLRGQTQQLRISLLARREKERPELNDEFARTVGDFESFEDLRAKVREDLQSEARDRAESVVRGRLLDLVVDANPFTVPVSMVERYVESLLGNVQQADPDRIEEFKASVRPEAERAVKRILMIDRVAETQDLRATEDDIDARVEEIARRTGASEAEVYARLQKSGALERLERELTETKVLEFLESRSEVTDAA